MTRANDDRRTDRTTTNRTDDDAPSIPGRTPPTEEAGAPIVPDAGTLGDRSGRWQPSTESIRPRTRPPSEGERDAPLVPDLRPIECLRTEDTGSDNPDRTERPN